MNSRLFRILGIQQIAIGGLQGSPEDPVGRHVQTGGHRQLRQRARERR